MKILITGIGITGKSTLRKKINRLISPFTKTWHLDMDYDRKELPQSFAGDTVYIIEDVHGTTTNAMIPLSSFDIVLYLLPKTITCYRFWLKRMLRWFENGFFAWDADKGGGSWSGTGKKYDLNNLLPIWAEFSRNAKNKTRWIKEDLHALKIAKVSFILIIPKLKKGQLTFIAKI